MTTNVVRFAELSDHDREAVLSLPKLADGDQVELHVRRPDGGERALALPPAAVAVVEVVLAHLLRGERVVVLSEDQELSPNEAVGVLGISRPLVVHRMDVGDLPFRYVGKHRRAKLKDVLTLKSRLDAQKAALDAFAEDTEALIRDHGL